MRNIRRWRRGWGEGVAGDKWPEEGDGEEAVAGECETMARGGVEGWGGLVGGGLDTEGYAGRELRVGWGLDAGGQA